jgi:uncharacterized protein YdeI (YjbR/CyaY-like superfamily)
MKRTTTRKSTLKRDINPMPKNIRSTLIGQGLLKLYNSRPAYQRNDYLGWISRAKLDATKEKRINQMLRELKQGDSYMGMRWNPK